MITCGYGVDLLPYGQSIGISVSYSFLDDHPAVFAYSMEGGIRSEPQTRVRGKPDCINDR